MPSIELNPGALANAGEQLDAGQPVVMVNLLRFAVTARYQDGTERTGVEAYRHYSKLTWPLLQKVNGEVVYHGDTGGMLIAPEQELWDEVLMVRYPDFEAFLSMIKSDEYGEIVHHRMAALDDSRLLATQSRGQ